MYPQSSQSSGQGQPRHASYGGAEVAKSAEAASRGVSTSSGRNNGKQRERSRTRSASRSKGKEAEQTGEVPKEKEKDGGVMGVAGTVKGLWSGRVAAVVVLREKEAERERFELGLGNVGEIDDMKEKEGEDDKNQNPKTRWVSVSDEEADRKRDLRSSEEESDLFGGIGKPWSGRVQKKLEAWAR